MGSPFKISSECKEVPYQGSVAGAEGKVEVRSESLNVESLQGSGILEGDVVYSVGGVFLQDISPTKWNELWSAGTVSLKIRREDRMRTVFVPSKYRPLLEAMMAKGYSFECQTSSGVKETLTFSQNDENSIFKLKAANEWTNITKSEGQVFRLGFYDTKFSVQTEAGLEGMQGSRLPVLTDLTDEYSTTPDIDIVDEAWRKTFKDDIGELGWDNPFHAYLVIQQSLYPYSDEEVRKIYSLLNDLIKELREALKNINTKGLTPSEVATLKLEAFNKLFMAKGFKYLLSSDFVGSINGLTYDCDLYSAVAVAVGYDVEEKPWPLRGVNLPRHYLLLWDNQNLDTAERVLLSFDQGDFSWTNGGYKKNFRGYYWEDGIYISGGEVKDQLSSRSESYEEMFSKDKTIFYSKQGEIFEKKGLYAEAEKRFKLAIKYQQITYAHLDRWVFTLEFSNLSAKYMALHRLYVKLKDTQKADLVAEKALMVAKTEMEITPRSRFTRLRFMEVHARLGRDEEALKLARASNTLGDDSDDVFWNQLAWVYAEIQKNDKVLQTLEEATQAKPASAHLWIGLAEIYKYDFRDKDALAAYQKALQCKPESTTSDMWKTTGDDLVLLGDLEGAKKAYERAKATRFP